MRSEVHNVSRMKMRRLVFFRPIGTRVKSCLRPLSFTEVNDNGGKSKSENSTITFFTSYLRRLNVHCKSQLP